MSSKTQPSNADDPYRLYFQLPEKRVDLNRLKMICLQLSDGTELWFEKQSVAAALLKKLSEAEAQLLAARKHHIKETNGKHKAESHVKELETKVDSEIRKRADTIEKYVQILDRNAGLEQELEMIRWSV